MAGGIFFAAASTCWGCGRTIRHRTAGGPRRWHGCRLRLLSRARWRSHLGGWHEGYRFAVENRDDPLVLADGADYGTGWAGHMRVGHLTPQAVRGLLLDEERGDL